MPAAMQYFEDPNDEAARDFDENKYYPDLEKRRARYAKNYQYYRGNMTKLIQEDGSKVKNNLVVPLFETIIDKSVSMMNGTDDQGMIDGVQFEVPTENDENGNPLPNPSQELLDNFWQANRKNKKLHEFFMSGSLTGHYAIKLLADDLPDPDGGSMRYPRIVILDMALVSVFWKEDDADTVLWYRIETGESPRRHREDIVRDGSTWTIYNYNERATKDTQTRKTVTEWVADGEPVIWGYEWAPIHDDQNLPVLKAMGYYGKDDCGTLHEMNDAINFLVSNEITIQKNYGNPIYTATFKLPRQVPTDENSPIVDIRSGAVFDDIGEKGKLDVVRADTDNEASQRLRDYIQSSFFSAGREVDPNTIKDKLGDLTNFGLRILYNDALSKRQAKWLGAADVLSTVCQHALELMGQPANMKVNVIPPDALPADPETQTRSLQTDVEVFGLSQDTALKRRGHDPDKERELRGKMSGERITEATTINNARRVNSLMLMGRQMRNGNGQQPEIAI